MDRGELELQLIRMTDVFSKHLTIEDDKTVMKWRYSLMDYL